MKVAIVGSRNYNNLEAVRKYVRALPKGTTVVSGGARGVDSVAEAEALACGLTVQSIPANWNKFGKRAGPIRNKEIVEASDIVVAFWDGTSKGTRSTIGIARDLNKAVDVRRTA